MPLASPLIVIPARLGATRLPGKPLADIHGVPMIVHVWRRAVAAEAGPVVVACAERAIADAVERAGGRAVLTRADHPSGSDRVHEAAMRLDPERRHEVVVNLQGDLPTLDPAAIAAALAPLRDPAVEIATLAAPMREQWERASPAAVKVAAGFAPGARIARALYFSRNLIPWGDGAHYHHIGIYAYRRAALERFVALPPSPLELREKLEQLRALEAGMRIDVALVDSVPLGVDTPEDLARARALLESRPLMTDSPETTIAFQGAPGAYSDLACRQVFPGMTTLPCAGFEDAIAAVRDGAARLVMLPIENSVAGRVADIHHLMPDSNLSIIGEHYQRVEHHLLAPPGATIAGLKSVHSHVHALSQCRGLIRELGVAAIVEADTAGAAAQVAARGDISAAAIASELAGEIYGLASLRRNIEDAEHNTTRFLIMAREPRHPPPGQGLTVTTFVFAVRNVPAALYKAMGGFATNGINMTKLESYMVGGRFTATQFYADVEGHPEERPLRLALEELRFFSREVKILGVYPGHAFRREATQGDGD